MIRLAVRVQRAEAEIVLASLLELAPSGVEEADLPGGLVEYAVYGAAGELPALPDLRAAAGDALVDVSTTEIADGWSERWREFHRSVRVDIGGGSRALVVRPPWEAGPLGGVDADEVVIDPGQAFGTGAHATTRLCLELLLELARDGRAHGPLCDVGTGSGVLAIAAVRLGFAPVQALDHDPLAVAAARENARVNGVTLAVSRWDLRRDRPPGAPVVVANLLAPLLRELAVRWQDATPQARPAVLIASGLLLAELDDVGAVLCRALRARCVARRSDGDWGALMLERERGVA